MIVGMMGYAQSGKDTAASALVDIGFERLAFAEGVRALAEAVNPLVYQYELRKASKYNTVVRTYGYEYAKNPDVSTVRDVLVGFGAGVRKVLGEDAWVAPVRERLLEEPERNFVITDVRYANEAKMIRERGGYVVWVVRPGVVAASSEERRSLAEFFPDFTVRNDGTEDELRERMISIYKDATKGGW